MADTIPDLPSLGADPPAWSQPFHNALNDNSGFLGFKNRADGERELAYLLLHGLDWGQTRDIASKPNRFTETNAFLGEHPSDSDVNRYFALTGLGHYALSRMLPSDWARVFQNVTAGLENGVTNRNAMLGVQVKFR